MQLDLIKKIVRLVPAYRVARDAGFIVRREKQDGIGARFYVEHPKHSEERLYLTEYEFVEAGKSTGFFAGNAFDFLSIIEGSLERAVITFFDRYRDKIHTVTSFEEGLIKDYLKNYTERTRRGFDFLSSLTANYQNSSKFHDIVSWQRGKQINPNFLTHWGYHAEPSQVYNFLEGLFGDESDFPFDVDTKNNYLVIPYYNTWSNISHLVFEQPTEGRRHRVDLNPCRVAWAGLHGSPHFRPARVSMFYNTPREAMIMQTYYRDRIDDSLCLHTDLSRDFADASTIRFMRGLILADEKTNFTVCARLADCVDQLHVQRFDKFAAHGDPVNWPRYLAEELQTIEKQDGENSPRARAMLSSVEIDGDLRIKLMQELEVLGASPYTRDMVTNWAGGDTFKFRGCTIEETKHGYLVGYNNRADQTLVSNFTIDVERNVVMADTGRVLLTGLVRMNDLAFPFEMDKKNITTPRGIEESVLTCFNRWLRTNQRTSRDQRVPVITVPDQARQLTGVLGQKCAAAPYDEGYGVLGWVNEDTFVAPYWMRRELSLTEGRSPVVIDGFDFVQHYRFSQFPQQLAPRTKETDFLSYEAKAFLRTLVVWIVRGSFGYDCIPERVQDGARTRNLLKAINSVFGQVSPLVLNPTSRRNNPDKLLKGLSRLPLYANTNNADALCEMHYPMWVLGEEGAQVPHKLTHHELSLVTNVTYHLVNRVLDWIATGDAVGVISFSTTAGEQQNEAGIILDKMFDKFGADAVVDSIRETPVCKKWIQILSGKYDEAVKRLIQFDLDTSYYVVGKRQRAKEKRLPYTCYELIDECRDSGFEVQEAQGRFWVPSEFIETQLSLGRKGAFKFDIYRPAPSAVNEDKPNLKVVCN